jgi:hypothetical protein
MTHNLTILNQITPIKTKPLPQKTQNHNTIYTSSRILTNQQPHTPSQHTPTLYFHQNKQISIIFYYYYCYSTISHFSIQTIVLFNNTSSTIFEFYIQITKTNQQTHKQNQFKMATLTISFISIQFLQRSTTNQSIRYY